VPSRDSIRCYCPANGRLLGYVEPDTPADIDRAVDAAEAAQHEWAKTTFGQRRKVLNTLRKYVLFFLFF
jgi:acyl-CoA reductase-like NAD-dependent aldehyde dehydrogenase